jgi:predicted membrane-bound mannosyltransferase
VEGSFRGNGLGAVVNPRAGSVPALLPLGIKPPHFDEGINGWFVDQVMKNGFYRYDPTNYHGPLHFYVLLLFESLFGRNCVGAPFACRAVEHRLCVACVEVRATRRKKREPNAALAMAISPGFVFYGRLRHSRSVAAMFSMLLHLGLLGLWRRGTLDLLAVCRSWG